MAPAGLRILVVDWHESVAQSIALVLKSAGFDAVTAFSGEEAITKASQGIFDVLLTDVMMEPMNGIQTALAFLQLQSAARVILLSGHHGASPLLLQAALAGHNFPILAKPVHPTELFSWLRGETLAETGGNAAVH